MSGIVSHHLYCTTYTLSDPDRTSVAKISIQADIPLQPNRETQYPNESERNIITIMIYLAGDFTPHDHFFICAEPVSIDFEPVGKVVEFSRLNNGPALPTLLRMYIPRHFGRFLFTFQSNMRDTSYRLFQPYEPHIHNVYINPLNIDVLLHVSDRLQRDICDPYCMNDHPFCSICLNEDNIHSGYVTTHCTHTFHSECFDTWFIKSKTCPLCRSVLI